MKCEECQEVIEEYFDGELGERASVDVRAHIMNCEACARSLEALKDEQSTYALYCRDLEVRPELWAGVAARIRQEEPARGAPFLVRWSRQLAELFGTPRLSPALTFALLVLAVGATAGLMKFMQSRSASVQPVAQKQPDNSTTSPQKLSDDGSNSPANATGDKESGAVENDSDELAQASEKSGERLQPALRLGREVESKRTAERTTGFAGEGSSDQLVREAEQKYMAAIALLARDARRRRTLLEPDVRARFEQTLAAVDRAIGETRRAARQQPDDPVAVQYMLAAYAKKVEILREMATYRVDDRDIQ